jgi:hypothetical protein
MLVDPIRDVIPLFVEYQPEDIPAALSDAGFQV